LKLYVMRHGPAEDEAESGRDADRALTHSGRDRVRSVAKALADADEVPLNIFTSPLVRCVQTAEIVAVGTKLSDRGGGVEVRRELAPGGLAAKLVTELVAQSLRRVMLCGHEPDCSVLVGHLLGSPLPVPMGKAMVVGLHIGEAVDGAAPVRLRFVLEPKDLSWEYDAR
jgi:phosphohistidine phosphatase